jgi:hypothetical protein
MFPWEWWHYLAFATVIAVGFEILNRIIPVAFERRDRIAVTAAHLDALSTKVRFWKRPPETQPPSLCGRRGSSRPLQSHAAGVACVTSASCV